MTDKEQAVLELLQAMNNPRDRDRIAAAFDTVFPNYRPWDGRGDTETYHAIADEALLSLVPKEIADEFDKLEKWYA